MPAELRTQNKRGVFFTHEAATTGEEEEAQIAAAVAASLVHAEAQQQEDALLAAVLELSATEDQKTESDKALSVEGGESPKKLKDMFPNFKDVSGDGKCLPRALNDIGFSLPLEDTANQTHEAAQDYWIDFCKNNPDVVINLHVFNLEHSFVYNVDIGGGHIPIPLILISGKDGAGDTSGHYMVADSKTKFNETTRTLEKKEGGF